ncbi:MAG: 2-amino-4-hydroxy-6-hydroxymethyldihydropteridine diphosphokinase [Proteobacteria bacterium]|nr:2-amino-4-hydroxy-6-hydroxymethyldihydropteridine diphosphokinase [Pseudomonadota bacterium]
MLRWRPAYVALGSNLGQPATQVRDALDRLASLSSTLLVARSRLWATPPMGPPGQPDYVNAVAGLLTRLGPRELLGELQAVERAMGRSRPPLRWGPRLIDLDLLACGAETVAEPGLSLPHPGLHQRDFVLYPLAEIAPQLWIPGRGRVSTLAGAVENRGSVALGE